MPSPRHPPQLEQELTFKLKAVLGVSVHRVLEGGTVCPTPQKVSADVEMTRFSISWLPPVRGSKVPEAERGGKRPDEHPMRMGQIRAVDMDKAAGPEDPFPARLKVTNEDGRAWVLAFDSVADCAMMRAGLRAAAKC